MIIVLSSLKNKQTMNLPKPPWICKPKASPLSHQQFPRLAVVKTVAFQHIFIQCQTKSQETGRGEKMENEWSEHTQVIFPPPQTVLCRVWFQFQTVFLTDSPFPSKSNEHDSPVGCVTKTKIKPLSVPRSVTSMSRAGRNFCNFWGQI